jgi:hypothetical protein
MNADATYSRVQTSAAVDALRSGVVNSHVANMFTYGRDHELTTLMTTVENNPEGSTQLVIGRHGLGKSHLCHVLAHRLMMDGYSVVHLEMGASHGRAEQPQAVLQTIERNIQLLHRGLRVRGGTQIAMLFHAMLSPSHADRYDWDYEARVDAFRRYPSDERVAERLRLLREFRHDRDAQGMYCAISSLFGHMPSAMTAVNYAVRRVNRAAHSLRRHGFKGIVLLFDEAERTEWASTSYRANRAHDLVLGFGLAAANKPTASLKHYRDETHVEYLERKPSAFHSIFFFTWEWGLASTLQSHVGCRPIQLSALGAAARKRLIDAIASLYGDAYDGGHHASRAAQRPAVDDGARDDIRSLVRETVAALDAHMWPAHA